MISLKTRNMKLQKREPQLHLLNHNIKLQLIILEGKSRADKQ